MLRYIFTVSLWPRSESLHANNPAYFFNQVFYAVQLFQKCHDFRHEWVVLLSIWIVLYTRPFVCVFSKNVDWYNFLIIDFLNSCIRTPSFQSKDFIGIDGIHDRKFSTIINHRLPTLYWLPKLHKRPYKARFIDNSRSCTTTVLSTLLTSCFTAIKNIGLDSMILFTKGTELTIFGHLKF